MVLNSQNPVDFHSATPDVRDKKLLPRDVNLSPKRPDTKTSPTRLYTPADDEPTASHKAAMERGGRQAGKTIAPTAKDKKLKHNIDRHGTQR